MGGTCTECGQNTYKDRTVNDSMTSATCEACPSNSVTMSTGSMSMTDCCEFYVYSVNCGVLIQFRISDPCAQTSYVPAHLLNLIVCFSTLYAAVLWIYWDVQPSPFMYWFYHRLVIYTFSALAQIHNAQTNNNAFLTIFIS